LPLRDNALVSVIVPTKNSEATLEACLRSIKKQTYADIEMRVVDSFSADKTQKIAENHGARIVAVNAKRSKARNIGVEKAKGEVILFVDSDMELDSTVVEECVKKVREGYHAVIVPEVSVGQGFWARCKALEKLCYIGDEMIEAARFFRKDIFDAVGGYDLELEAGEDWDLDQRVRRAGYRIGRIYAFVRHNEGWLSLREAILKKHYYGKTIERYRMKHPEEAKQQLKLIRPAFVRNWRKLFRDPIHALGMLFMKFCEFVAGGTGYLKSRFSLQAENSEGFPGRLSVIQGLISKGKFLLSARANGKV
jgi:glycosyltransferase involved in cell wall biosynthesis